MNALRAWSFPFAIACLLAAAGIWLLTQWYAGAQSTWLLAVQGSLSVVGIVLLVVSVAVRAREVRTLAGRRSTRYGASALLLIALALGIVVAANALSLRHSKRWDLTENKRNSLSPLTIKVLQGLPGPVEAIAFFRSDMPNKRTAEDLLKQYATFSNGKFTWRVEDPDRAPGVARRYGVENYGTVVLERAVKGDAKVEPKSEKVLDAEEERLTNGLVKLTREGKRIVYVIKGHGEADIANTERVGLSQAKEQLEKANYEVKDLLLARDANVPDDAAVVVLAGPRTDLLAPELQAIDAYIGRGGKVLFMVSPFTTDGLAKHLARYGFSVGDDVILEQNPVGQLFGVGPEVPVVTQYEGHAITRDLGGMMTLFPVTRSVEPAKDAPKGVSVQALAKTSTQSWGETDKGVFQGRPARLDTGERRGPLGVAAVATIDAAPPAPAPAAAAPSAPAAEKKATKARIVVLGTPSLAINYYLGAQGNRDFFLNVVSWLAEEEDLLSIRPRDTRSSPVFLTAAQQRAVFLLPVVVLPALVFIAGISAVVSRRRAK